MVVGSIGKVFHFCSRKRSGECEGHSIIFSYFSNHSVSPHALWMKKPLSSGQKGFIRG